MRFAMIALLALLSGNNAHAQMCEATPQRHAQKVPALPYSDGMAPGTYPETYGTTPFKADMRGGRTFALLPIDGGWTVRVLETPADADSVDLSQITPMRAGRDPRDILASDLSRKDRLFFFSDALKGTGGLRQPPQPPKLLEPAALQTAGLGWLKIKDYGLSRDGRLTYLKIEGCLTWPKTAMEIAQEADAKRLDFSAADKTTFAQCGLDQNRYTLDAAFTPRLLRADVDGDGQSEVIAQVTGKSGRGVALCSSRHGLKIVSPEQSAGLRPRYIGQMEAWRVKPRGSGSLGYDGEPDWPGTDGDAILLERVEKEMFALFFKDGTLRSQRVYGYVDP